jgi:hypothetical protein
MYFKAGNFLPRNSAAEPIRNVFFFPSCRSLNDGAQTGAALAMSMSFDVSPPVASSQSEKSGLPAFVYMSGYVKYAATRIFRVAEYSDDHFLGPADHENRYDQRLRAGDREWRRDRP